MELETLWIWVKNETALYKNKKIKKINLKKKKF